MLTHSGALGQALPLLGPPLPPVYHGHLSLASLGGYSEGSMNTPVDTGSLPAWPGLTVLGKHLSQSLPCCSGRPAEPRRGEHRRWPFCCPVGQAAHHEQPSPPSAEGLPFPRY